MKHSIAKSILILILVVSLLTIGITAVMSVYEAEIFVRETMISKASNAAQVISHVYSGVFPETIDIRRSRRSRGVGYVSEHDRELSAGISVHCDSGR